MTSELAWAWTEPPICMSGSLPVILPKLGCMEWLHSILKVLAQVHYQVAAKAIMD